MKNIPYFSQLICHKTSVADTECLSWIPDPTFFHPGSRIPDPNCLHPGSRIRIKEFKYFNPKNGFYTLESMIRVVHPGSRIRMLTFYPSRIPDPGSKTDPQHCIKHTYAAKKSILKGCKSGFFANFCKFPCSWIRIRIPNTDPDLGVQNKADPDLKHGRKNIIFSMK
jgi:hypothetical protein